MKLDIQKVLTVSITHIPEEIAIKIERVCNKTAIYYTGISNLSIYKKAEYGWWIYVPKNMTDSFTNRDVIKELQPLIKLACENNCEWLCIDRDGDVVDFLPVYIW